MLQEAEILGSFEVYAIETNALVVGRLKGILDAKTAEQIVTFIETKEMFAQSAFGIPKAFNRFCDLSKLTGIRLSSDEVAEVARRRREFNPNDIRVKSAFFAPDPLAFGIARTYGLMLRSPRIEVRVWDDMERAAEWLGVTVERLTI